MKKFYFDGDSWMNGGGLELCGLSRKSRWSTLVCEHFGAEETNLAVGGAPIDTAMRHLFTGKCKKKEIPLHEFDMFFIQLSYPRRREYFCDIEKRWRRYHPEKEKWAEDYLKYKYSEVQGRVIEEIAVKSIRAYCKELGKPLFLCTQWKNANKDLDYDLFLHTYARLPDGGHPSVKGHRHIADDVIKFMTNELHF